MKMSRRDFLRSVEVAGVVALAGGAFPAWMPRLAFRDPKAIAINGDTLVVISLRGGMDGLNVVVPFSEGKYFYDMRPTIAIPEPGKGNNQAINLNDKFGLHPALSSFKDIFDAGQLAFVHAAGMIDPNAAHATRSHFDAMDMMERGTPGVRTLGAGWLNRHLQTAATKNHSPFRAIGMGGSIPTSLSGPAPALALKSIADFHLNGDMNAAAAFQKTLADMYKNQATPDQIGSEAQTAFDALKVIEKLNESEYVPANDAIYPDNDFGKGLKQIAQLVKVEIGLEVAALDLGGWDTHEGESGALTDALRQLNDGLYAFWTDLRDRMGNVSIVVLSEFGRRVEENASKGTDHGLGNVVTLVGGGIKGGMYARWPGLAPNALNDGDLNVTTDYREILSGLLINRMNNPAISTVFPGYSLPRTDLLDLFKARNS